MNRRHFIAAASLAGAAPAAAFGTGASAPSDRQYLELRHYRQLSGSKKQLLNDFLGEVAVPAYNRMGIGPVGVFTVVYGPNDASLYLLLPHNSMESVMTAQGRLLDDPEVRRSGADFLNVPLSDPAYLRWESSLMRAFTEMPKLEPPADKKENKGRLFELRIYESHGEKAARKKIEMFNEGGEIRIFRDTGLAPVFFGETLIGPRMPNLTYMLVFDDMAARDANWDTFRNSPAWKELSAREEYKDTVSNITDIILRPTAYSQY